MDYKNYLSRRYMSRNESKPLFTKINLPSKMMHSWWGSEIWGWFDEPKNSQDLLYDKMLSYATGATAHEADDWHQISGKNASETKAAAGRVVRIPETEWLIHYATTFKTWDDYTKSMLAIDLHGRRVRPCDPGQPLPYVRGVPPSGVVGFSSGRPLAGIYGEIINDENNLWRARLGAPSTNKCVQPLEEIPFELQFGWSTTMMVYDTNYPGMPNDGNFSGGLGVLCRSTAAVLGAGIENWEVIFRACSDKDGILFFEERGTFHILEPDVPNCFYKRTGQIFPDLLSLLSWADSLVGIKRTWPAPIPGYFKSVQDFLVYAQPASIENGVFFTPETRVRLNTVVKKILNISEEKATACITDEFGKGIFESRRNPIYWGRAGAGMMFFCQGQVLLLKRSADVEQPGTWGIPGGAVKSEYFIESEVGSPMDISEKEILITAEQETKEELGSLPQHLIFDQVIYRDGSFTYTTFLASIYSRAKNSWDIQLNWENEEATWYPVDALPSNLHFGVKYIIKQNPELFGGLPSGPLS